MNIIKLTILTMIVTFHVTPAAGMCRSWFSFSPNFEIVTFSNQSNVSNAHYFWNFGDGTGSNFQHPIHKFPETGKYLVTLFAHDTVSNCSAYYESWVDVTKYSIDNCRPRILDSIYTYLGTDYLKFGTDYLKLIDQSTNCVGYHSIYDCGMAGNFPTSWILNLGGYWQKTPFRMVCRARYYDVDGSLQREAYKTSLHHYSSEKNFGDCSANFEFNVISQDSFRQRILFKAMNKTAKYYEWIIAGFGAPITSNNDTISQVFSLGHWHVGLVIHGSSGCRDSLFQNIIIHNGPRTTVWAGPELNTGGVQPALFAVPNPSSGRFTITYQSPAILNKDVVIQVVNTLGQVVIRNNLSVQGTGKKFIIDLEDFPAGVYLLSVIGENIASIRLIKR